MAAGELLRFEHGELDGVEGSGHASDIAIHNQRGAAAQAIALAIGSVGEVPRKSTDGCKVFIDTKHGNFV